MKAPINFSVIVVAIQLLCGGLLATGFAPLAGASAPASRTPSWQESQATVDAKGDLAWAPRPFVFQRGASVRYIDYDGGRDDNTGETKDQPWQHHPWDAAATGAAKNCRGIHTYVFRRGVVYRGSLVAGESGQAGDLIRLTSDPDWGTGDAAIYGSQKITGGWARCDAQTAPDIPEPDKVWYLDIGTDFNPRCVWEVRPRQTTRIHLARNPNYRLTNPDDPMGDWFEWTNPKKDSLVNEDTAHLTQGDPRYYDGADVWSEWGGGDMGLPYLSPVLAYDPVNHTIQRKGTGPFGQAGRGSRYYLENLPAFLDSPGEYFYAAKGPRGGRLYLRLPEERDPNQSIIELGRAQCLLYIQDRQHITISGLRFSYLNVLPNLSPASPSEYPSAYYRPTAIRLIGDCQDIRIAQNQFINVPCAVRGAPRLSADLLREYAPQLQNNQPGPIDVMADLSITDNDIAHVDEGAILLQDGGGDGGWRNYREQPTGELGRVEILRNRVVDACFRPSTSYNAPAIEVTNATLAEVAGNMVDSCWGVGIWALGGKNRADPRDRPLVRVLVHHNKVINALLAANDWGAFAVWQGGPFYVFDNISGNPMGPKHEVAVNRKLVDDGFPDFQEYSSNGYAYYLDGAYKSYVFNNIAWGKRNDLTYWLKNRAAFMMVVGFMNSWFNNTAYKFTYGATGSSSQRAVFLGNIFADITNAYFGQDMSGDISLQGGGVDTEKPRNASAASTLAYGSNVFFGKPLDFSGTTSKTPATTLEEYRAALRVFSPWASGIGEMAEEMPLVAPDKGDFRPRKGSPAIGRGVRFFVPWGLYMTVGEWSFCRFNADPKIIMGGNFFMSDEYVERMMYDEIPRNDLSVPGATADDYASGALEDWTDGALLFNGKDRYCILPEKELTGDYVVSQALVGEGARKALQQGRFIYPGAQRRTVDMGTNNFLIEAYFKTKLGHTNGVLIAKAAEAGYTLDIDAEGHARLTLRPSGQESGQQSSSSLVNDGRWHHVIAEVDRSAGRGGITLYVDGKAANGVWSGTMPARNASLSNPADFLVGKDTRGHFFSGTLDFLRVSRGTLADAKTTIEELYAWEFAGPALQDFTGKVPFNAKRDAGAIQSQ